MITQEKKLSTVLSISEKGRTASPTACQPSVCAICEETGEITFLEGFDELSIATIEADLSDQTNIDFLQGKIEILTKKLNIYQFEEQSRLDDLNAYRFKCLLEDQKEQEKIAELEKVPLLLTRGAHTPTTSKNLNKTIIDWVSFTSNETPLILKEFSKMHIEGLFFETTKKGMTGYSSVINISKDGEQIGLIGHGSSHGKNLLTFTGKGCKLIADWFNFKYWLEKLEDFSITRLDIAKDFFNGEITHDIVLNAYKQDKFKVLKSSKSPSIGIQSTVDGMGRNRGRTINIGGRKTGKSGCCYEKGLEQFSKLYSNNNLKDDELNLLFTKIDCHDMDERVPEGTELLNWYRIEIRFGNADKVLSSDMLINNDCFFVGSYPFCEEIMENTEIKKPLRLPNNLETDIEIMFKHIREQYGSFFSTIRASDLMTDIEILNKACNGKINKRIVKAGGLKILKPYSPK